MPEGDNVVHRALRIIEVYERIYEAADRRSLAQLAQTCKTFDSTARRVLWRTIPNLSPLIRCFPTGSWLISRGTMRTTRIILPHEWTRFLENAHFVQVIGLNSVGQRPWLDVSAMETLTGLRPTLVLFPNITTLNSPAILDGLKPEYLPMVLLMMGHRLKTLHLGSWDRTMNPEAVFRASVSLSATRFPNLQNVQLNPMGVNPGGIQLETWTSITSLLSSLPSLRKLECHRIPLTPDALKILLQIPTLRELFAGLPNGVNWLTLEQASQPVAPLTKISLFTKIQAYTEFAQVIALPHAETFIFEIIDVAPDPDSIAPFFTAIRRQVSPASLRSLTIESSFIARFAQAGPNPVVLRPSHLRPLLDFLGMKHFILSLVCKSALDAAFLRDVARAWPRLTKLSLLCDRFCTPHSLPPLNALVPFAIHCPDLNTLRVVVYAASDRQEHMDLGEFGGRASTSKLEVLEVGASPISGPATVAVTITRMFPSLGRVLCRGFPEETDPQGIFQAGWDDVSLRYLPMFALVRQDERLRIAQEDRERGGG